MKKLTLDLEQELHVPLRKEHTMEQTLQEEAKRESKRSKSSTKRKNAPTQEQKSWKVSISSTLKKQVSIAAAFTGDTKAMVIEKAIQAYCASINKSYRMNRFSGYSDVQLQAFVEAANTVLKMPGTSEETKKDAQLTINIINQIFHENT